MKKTISLCVLFSIIMCIFSSSYASASSNDLKIKKIEYFDDGSYIVTETDIDNPTSFFKADRSFSFITGSTTTTYYSSSNEALCALKITGTFKYDGNTVSCTNKYYTTYSYNSDWTVEDTSSSSGTNSSSTQAYAKADGKFVKRTFGIVVKRIPFLSQ